MTTRPNPEFDSDQQPVTLRKRDDLAVQEQRHRGLMYWMIEDPICLRHFRFQPEEYSMLETLDGHRSLAEIQRIFERRFPPQRINLDELKRFLWTLLASRLVISDARGRGPLLKREGDRQRRWRWWTSLTKGFTITLARREAVFFFERVCPYVGWFMSSAAIIGCFLLGLAGLALAAANPDAVGSFLAAAKTWAGQPRNWPWLAVLFSGARSLHELGHAVACYRFSGRNPGIDLTLVAGLPLLAVDVRELWMVRSKWRRLMIQAAGIHVDVVLTVAAAVAWWFSPPGAWNHLCLGLAIAAGASLLWNINPLLPGDSHYLLATLVEVFHPDLAARRALGAKLAEWFCGLPAPEDHATRRLGWLLFLYGTMAAACRLAVALAVFWVLMKAVQPLRVPVLDLAVATAATAWIVVRPIWNCTRYVLSPERWPQVKRPRLAASLLLLALLTLFVLVTSAPRYATCEVRIESVGADVLRAPAGGRLDRALVRPNEIVAEGQAMFVIAAEDDRGAAGRSPDGKSRPRSAAAPWTVKSPRRGRVVPGATEPGCRSHALAARSALDPNCTGAPLAQGDLLCRVVDADRALAVCEIGQEQFDLLAVGQMLEIHLSALPDRTWQVPIERLVWCRAAWDGEPTPGTTAPVPLAFTEAASGRASSCLALASVDDSDGILQPGLRGHGRVLVGRELWLERVLRFLASARHLLP